MISSKHTKGGGHLSIIPLTLQILVVIGGAFIAFMITSGAKVPMLWLGVFGLLLLFSNFSHLMYGMNPIGMILSSVIILSALLMIKVGFTSTARGFLEDFFRANMLGIVVGYTVLDVIRDLVDGG